MARHGETNDTLRLGAIGEWMVLAADELAVQARDELAQGVPEEVVRKRVLARGENLEIAGARSLFPFLNRKVLRLSLPKVLHGLVDAYFSKRGSMKVRDAVHRVLDNIGFDEWFVDFVMARARGEEPAAMLPLMTGKVWSQPIGLGEDKTEAVWVVITPLSDPTERLEEAFELCKATFPGATWSRYATSTEGARIFRKHHADKMSFRQIAEENLGEHWRDEPALRKEELDMETARVRKLYYRYRKYWDSLGDELSPESD